jgi:hypothetical protein
MYESMTADFIDRVALLTPGEAEALVAFEAAHPVCQHSPMHWFRARNRAVGVMEGGFEPAYEADTRVSRTSLNEAFNGSGCEPEEKLRSCVNSAGPIVFITSVVLNARPYIGRATKKYGEFRQADYDLGTAAWRTVIGPLHPDDLPADQIDLNPELFGPARKGNR